MLRGLSIRLSYVEVVLNQKIGLINSREVNDLLLNVSSDAHYLGYADASNNQEIMPALFDDVPLLESAWHDGWAFKSELDEIESCPGCKNSHGDPCCIHG